MMSAAVPNPNITAGHHNHANNHATIHHHYDRPVWQLCTTANTAYPPPPRRPGCPACGQLDDVCAGKKKKKKKGWFKRKKKRKVDGDDGNGEGGDAANHVEHARGDQAARQAALHSAETSGLMGPPSPTGGQYSDIASAPSPTAGHYSDISSAPSAAPIAPSPGSLTAYLDVRPSTKAESPYGASGATRRRATGAAAAPVHDMYNESPTPMPTCDTAGHAEVVVQQGRETPFATYGNNERTGLLSAAEIGLEDDDDSCCTIA